MCFSFSFDNTIHNVPDFASLVAVPAFSAFFVAAIAFHVGCTALQLNFVILLKHI
jgi:hypothetical protein